MKQLFATLFAALFATSVFAQAPKAETKKEEAKPAAPAKAEAKKEEKKDAAPAKK